MTNWTTYKIKELGRVVTGKTPASKYPHYFGHDFPFITPSDFKKYIKNADGAERYISIQGSIAHKNAMVPAKSVLVTCIGSDMGKVVMNTSTCLTNQQINSVVPDLGKVEPDFLYYSLVSQYSLLRSMGSDGTTMPIVNKTDFENIELLLPNLPTQRRIAEILSALDDKIELNRRMNQTLEQMAQTLFRQYFVDGIDEENMPEGWRVSKLGEVTSRITKGTTPTTLKRQFVEAGINFIKVESITETGTIDLNKLNFIDEETDQLLSRSRIQDQDILFSIAGTLGRMAVVSPEILPANTNQAVAIIRPDSTLIEPLFIYYWLKLEKVREEAFSRKVHAVQANLSLGVLNDIEIIVPPLSIQNKKFVEINNLFKKIKCNGLEIQKLTQLRDTLLPKLMSGEIDVMQIKPEELHEPVLS